MHIILQVKFNIMILWVHANVSGKVSGIINSVHYLKSTLVLNATGTNDIPFDICHDPVVYQFLNIYIYSQCVC